MPQKTDLLLKFGERIRDLRKQKSVSQEDLAFKAGVHRTYIGMIERGEKNITLENINKLAIALDISIGDLLDNF
jgi:transcriptional regulator with XRE-family HTH domain